MSNESGQAPTRTAAGRLRKKSAGDAVTLMGWVHRTRDFGGVVFVQLRDRSGIVQIVFAPDLGEIHELASKLRPETVISVSGSVSERSPDTVNPDMETGEIEIRASGLEILAHCDDLPLQPAGAQIPSEETRLKYRYLDLRRTEMRHAIEFRSRIVSAIRETLHRQDFWDVETPILTKSTPEGARDYLVPSRVHAGKFYALPQSPQIFKQLLMVAGVERYYQIARCFRDEDLRADRQPEFTQVDIEMSFVQPQDVQDVAEAILHACADISGWKIPETFPRMSYAEAMDRFGSDAPDLRYALEIVDVTKIAGESPFIVFKSAVEKGGVVRGIALRGAAGYTRKQLDTLTDQAKKLGAGGLVWFKWGEEGVKGPAVKALGEDQARAIIGKLGAQSGDLALIVAGPLAVVRRVLGALRSTLASAENLIDSDRHELLWVTDFPLFEWDEDSGRYFACHHPFTSPDPRDVGKLESSPGEVKALAYDLVLDGQEIGGGSIRIHRTDLQQRVFRALGIDDQEASDRFGFLLDALRYGAPPHGGIALGLDRLVAILCGRDSIRDVIAFPKTTSASSLMTDAPSAVDEDQLRELGLALRGERD